VSYQIADEKEVYDLDLIEMKISEVDLVGWLDRQLHNGSLTQLLMIDFLSRMVSH
jgi:hypothetical protein